MPALNEEAGIGAAIKQIPVNKLNEIGHSVEIIVVDNGSTDNTARIAREKGAIVVLQPQRGYGNAYAAGFEAASGDIIVTGDADMTYPFDHLPGMICHFLVAGLDFLNTDRLSRIRPDAMNKVHVVGNRILTWVAGAFFKWPFTDSQSGMWIFKRSILPDFDLRSKGMPFSQEIKIEAFVKGFKCAEIPIDYRVRAGKVKLNTFIDGFGNIAHLFKKRFFPSRLKSEIALQDIGPTD